MKVYNDPWMQVLAFLVRMGWVLGPWRAFPEFTPLPPCHVGSAMSPKGPKTGDHLFTFCCMTE